MCSTPHGASRRPGYRCDCSGSFATTGSRSPTGPRMRTGGCGTGYRYRNGAWAATGWCSRLVGPSSRRSWWSSRCSNRPVRTTFRSCSARTATPRIGEAEMSIVLGANQYGKAETRLVRVDRDGERHAVRDLNVSVALRGDLEGTHLTGDNATVLPTDSMKNTVYAFARRYGVGAIEDFGLRLARHFVNSQPSIEAARIAIEEYGWTRLGPHSFARDGGETRTAVLTYDGNAESAVGGVGGQ